MRDYGKEVGRLLDARYKLLNLIGQGASGAVFRAYDFNEKKEVAIKFYYSSDKNDDKNLSFMNETRAISALKSEHIVELYDTGVSEEGDLYTVMEYVDGYTLRDFIDNRNQRHIKIEADEILIFCKQILEALSVAHKSQILHRDIKPQNILLSKTGTIKLTDFGIAKILSDDPLGNDFRAIGTAHYISPEQATGNAIDARSDIYSLGIILYEMATGVVPFTGDTPEDIAKRQVSDIPIDPCKLEPSIPKGLQQIILTAMQKNPDRRFTSATEMLRAVMQLSKNQAFVFQDFSNDATATKTGARHAAAKQGLFKPLVLGIAGACIIALVILLVSIINNGDNNHYTELPNLVGTFYSEDLSSCLPNNISIKNVQYEYKENTEAGTIIRQDPEAGTYIDTLEVTLWVSLGEKEPLDLTTYIGKEIETFFTFAEANAISYETSYISSNDVASGKIISISETSWKENGEKILVVVSLGEASVILMPNLINMPYASAIQLLNDLHILAKLNVVDGSSENIGLVVAQSISEGEEVSTNTPNAVTITIVGGIS